MTPTFRNLLLAATITFATAPLSAEVIVPVSTATGLQQAIDSATEGVVIELAAGTYAAPNGSWTIYNPTAGFTIRAAAGATVALNGGGGTDILRFTNSQKPITFQGITFLNGVSNSNFIGGAITIDHANAIFLSCTFQNNAANGSSTGGGGLWLNAVKVLFQSCNFTGNTSPNYGAAFSALDSQVYINNSRFSGNRSNLTNHHVNSAGGAIQANACLLRIENCRFDNNQAGLAGGAIYAYGPWKDPVTTPATTLIVSNSTFTGNLAVRGSGGPIESPAIGGAVFSEDQTTAQFFNCRFTGNTARLGGALGSYRAIVEVVGCVFKDNQATGSANDESIGGAIISLSVDNNDASTDNGKINRRSSRLTVRDTLIQGVLGTNSAGRGGGIFASGDLAAAYVKRDGTVESNRASVTLTRVAFMNLSAIGDDALGSGLGGAFQGDFASLTADNVIVANCSASNYGGGFRFGQNCAVTMSNTTIAQAATGRAGGGITMFGGVLNLTNCSFVENQLTIGTQGTAICAGVGGANGSVPATDMTGLVQGCVFSNNGAGAVIYDSEPPGLGVYNRLQYSSNQFFSPPNDAYVNDNAAAHTVPELNALAVRHADGSTDIKAPSPNFALGAAPSVGAILTLPPTTLRTGAPDEAVPVPTNVAYASNGVGGTTVDGTGRANSGVLGQAGGGVHTLTVGSISFATVPPPATALNVATRLPVGTGQNVLIGGFIIVGPTPKRVIIRAIGPSVQIAGALQDPTLELHDGTGALIARNDNWRVTQVGGVLPADQAIEIQAAIPPTNDLESAILATLNPGSYTAIVGANGSPGIGLVEVYDLDAIQDSTLANISTRGFVKPDPDEMIGGFIYLGGPGATKVVVRGLGPSLSRPPYNITNPLQDPVLELHDANGGTTTNDDWAAGIPVNFQPSDPRESAIFSTGLPLGNYTAILRGKNETGVGVVEVYIFE
jgi:predicted outer membrane repeat protein